MSVRENCLDRVLVVLADAGSIKPLLSWAILKSSEIGSLIVIANRDFFISKEFGIAIHIMDDSSALKLLDTFEPTFVLTGTSYPGGSFELRIIEACKTKNISVSTYFDHWQNFQARFMLQENLIYPDEIWVLDQQAYDFAVIEGLSSSKLQIVGNPFFNMLKTWRPVFCKQDFIKTIGGNYYSNYILYLPDFISGSNESSVIYGFDEFDVLNHIINFLEKNNYFESYTLVVKLHPSHTYELFQNYIQKHHKALNKNIIIIQNVDIKSLAYFASLIIGLFSMALLEAKIINPAVIRFCPNLKIRDPLLHLIPNVVYTEQEFRLLFVENLKKETLDSNKIL
jgi:hypothetical protein